MRSANEALLVIDVQNDFCAGGALEVPDGDAVVPQINGLLSEFSVNAFSQDWHPPRHSSFASEHPGRAPLDVVEMPYGRQVLWPDHCMIGTSGAAFHPDLDTNRAQMIVRKGYRHEIDSYSAFFENDHATPTGLEGYLRARDVDRVVVAGLALDFCVHFTAVDAAKLGFAVEVRTDLCRAIDANGSLDAAREAFAAHGVRETSS